MHFFCVVCGGPFSERLPFRWSPPVFPPHDPNVLSRGEVEWLSHVRVMGAANRLSPHGFVRDKYSVAVEDTDETFDVFRLSCGGNSHFPLHDDCLCMVEKFLQRRQDRASDPFSVPVLKNFYGALSHQYVRHLLKKPVAKSFGLEFEHGYYGARQNWAESWVYRKGWDWLCADPLFFEEDTTFYVLSLLRPCSQVILSPPWNSSQSTALYSESFSSSGLESLPQELLSMITSYLSGADVFRLRRCSKTLALHLPLEQRFWRERLISGDLIGWLWDLDEDECRAVDRLDFNTEQAAKGWDWQRLVLTLAKDPFPTETMDLSRRLRRTEEWRKWFHDNPIRENEELVDLPAGLRNRRRIWKIIEGIDDIATELVSEELDGEDEEEDVAHFALKGYVISGFDDNDFIEEEDEADIALKEKKKSMISSCDDNNFIQEEDEGY